MTRDQFDETFSFFPLSEIIQTLPSRTQVKRVLETFICSKNTDLQDFLHNQSMTFERHLRSRTYVYVDNETKEIAAYFSVAIYMLDTDDISPNIILMVDGYKDDVKTIPCFLIGQLGKSDHYETFKIGHYILADAVEKIDEAQRLLGGRFILLDAINDPKLIEFYRQNTFIPIEEDRASESIKMIKPYFEIEEL